MQQSVAQCRSVGEGMRPAGPLRGSRLQVKECQQCVFRVSHCCPLVGVLLEDIPKLMTPSN
ncbi:hypothetical protein E2C01_089505 [Portunus trituberculatus]|uniref:Uncharacterized protein n=1 Tax=Portunus trituberculatus TaxID=210409 RepID=A0A5B7J8Z4_PORTR|nr:hypothetical protein [Portunus trituberculatus]